MKVYLYDGPLGFVEENDCEVTDLEFNDEGICKKFKECTSQFGEYWGKKDFYECSCIPPCGIEGCKHPQYDEGVCFWHFPLREAWGYGGGYEIYMFRGQETGRKMFKKWLENLIPQEIIDIYAGYDFKLTAGTIQVEREILEE